MRVLVFVLFLSVMVCKVLADTTDTKTLSKTTWCNHSQYHHWYKTLLDKRGRSCCDDEDCQCARVRFDNGRYAVQIRPNGAWHFTDDNTKIFYDKPTPDGGPHACVVYNGFMKIHIVRCLVLPAAV